MPTTPIAPSLIDQGYTGATGTTPYKPASADQLERLRELYNTALPDGVGRVVPPSATVLNINFDGTQNNREFPAPGESQTNIGRLTALQEELHGVDNTLYLPGIGAPTAPPGAVDANGIPLPGSSPSDWQALPVNAGEQANSICERAYLKLIQRVDELRAEDPQAQISLNLSGFSRGAAEAVAFANLLQERGIPGLYEPGQVPIDTLTLLDPVDMTRGALNTTWPDNVKNSLVLVAMDEGRYIMSSMPVAGAPLVMAVPGGHADIGGSFNPDGISAVTLKVVRDFQEASGNSIAPIPDDLSPNWDHMRAHNSALDSHGNTVWSWDGNGRYYENASVGDSSVQKQLNYAAHNHPVSEDTPPPAADFGPPADLANPPNTPTDTASSGTGTSTGLLNLTPATVATLSAAATGLSLLNQLQGLEHWGQLDDLGRLQTLTTLAGTLNNLTDGGLASSLGLDPSFASNLGDLGAGLNLIAGLEHGDGLAVLSSLNSLTNYAIDGALNSAFNELLGGSNIPVLSLLNAASHLDDAPLQSIATIVGTLAGGPIVGGFVSTLASTFGGIFGFGGGGHREPPPPPPPPPPPDGSAHFAVGSDDSVHLAIDTNQSGGGTYTDGHTDPLTKTTLHADTDGVRLTQIRRIDENGQLQTLDAGDVLEHEGYQEKTWIDDGLGGGQWLAQHNTHYTQNAKRTGDWEGTAEADTHRHGSEQDSPEETSVTRINDTAERVGQGSRAAANDLLWRSVA